MSETDLNTAVQSAMTKPMACHAVHEIYDRLQLEIDQRKPLCAASGKCCHFEAYGHRLYVTTLELATFASDLAKTQQPKATARLLPVFPEVLHEVFHEGCPLQVDNLCSVHSIRPFGCRIFFCDPSATQWQQEQYERFHAELKQLHIQYDVPYFYVEWRAALAQLDLPKSHSKPRE